MARTLTAGAITWKAGTSYTHDWLIESSDLSIYWSFIEESAGAHSWEHRILSMSEIEMSIPPGGGLGAAQSVSIRVAETGATQSLRAIWDTNGQLDGADLTVSLLPDGEAYADKIVLFTGVIDGVKWLCGVEPGRGVGILTASSIFVQVDTVLPPKVINVNDFPSAPTFSLGKPLPILHGFNTAGTDPVAPMFPIDNTLVVYQVINREEYLER